MTEIVNYLFLVLYLCANLLLLPRVVFYQAVLNYLDMYLLSLPGLVLSLAMHSRMMCLTLLVRMTARC